MMSFNECIEAVYVKNYPAYLPELYDAMVADGSIDSTEIVSADYIRSVSDKYGLFEHTLDIIIESGKAIAENKALLRYTNLMAKAIYDRETCLSKGSPAIAWPETPDLAFDFAGMIAMLPSMEHPDRIIRERGMNDSIRKRTFRCFEGCIDIHVNRFGRPALNSTYYNWLRHYIDVDILDNGGFNFEMIRACGPRCLVLKKKDSDEIAVLMYNKMMHRDGMVLGAAGYADEEGSYLADFVETDAVYIGYPCNASGFCTGVKTLYPKSKWEIALAPGDPAMSVHIPRGTNLKGSAFIDAYKGALEIFAGYYPEFKPKAVVCYSWLMDTRIDEICGGAPNIKNFQSPFHAFPLPSAGKEVFSFVFIHPFDKLENLPEDTRLMRALKKRYLDGDYVHAFGGVFLL